MRVIGVLGIVVVTACSGGSGGPPSKKSGPTGGTGASGGSGGSAGQASGGSAGQASGGSGGKASVPNCYALCEWEVQVSGDCPVDALEQCKSACDVGGLVVCCVDIFEKMSQCLLDHADPNNVSCTGGPVTSNVPVINGSPPECDADVDAWVQCSG